METSTTIVTPNVHETEPQEKFHPSEVLNFERLTEFREAQRNLYNDAYAYNKHEGTSDTLAQYFASKAVESGIEDYLIDKGLPFEDATFNGYKNGLMELSILNFPEKNWQGSHERDEDGRPVQSGRERTIVVYENLTHRPYEQKGLIESTPEPVGKEEEQAPNEAGGDVKPSEPSPREVDPFVEAHKERLDTLRTKMAELSAKRQGRAFGRGGEAYQKALEQYNNQVIVYGKLTHKELLEDETVDEAEKSKQIVEYLFAEQNELRKESLEKLEGTKVHKFITGVAKLMDHEKKWVRVAKTIGVGAAIGATVTLVGGLGAGAAAVAGAGALGLKFARAYAQRDAKAGRGLAALDENTKESVILPEADPLAVFDANASDQPAAPTGFEQLQARFDTLFEDSIEKEQTKRKKTLAWAMGTVAAGATIAAAVDFLSGSDIFAVKAPEAVPSEEFVPPADDVIPSAPDQGVEILPFAPEVPEFVPDPAFYVPDGQGGIALFQNMGLTESDWYTVHQDLIAQFPDEFYNDGGDIRIAHSGQLSQGVQEYIKSRFHMS